MTSDKGPASQESPARRLVTLYIASFLMIAVLAGFGLSFLLSELSWQRATVLSVNKLTVLESSARPLSRAIPVLVAENDPRKRGQLLDAFRMTVERARRDSERATSSLARDSEFESQRILQEAESHRLSALRSADELLTLFEPGKEVAPPFAESGRLMNTILAEEEFAAQCFSQAIRSAGAESKDRIDRLQLLEIQLFVIGLIVLTLEGLFVVDPAIRKIRAFMDEVVRSNEGLRTYAIKLEQSNKELQDFASVASHDLQEPLRKVQAFSDRLRTRSGAVLDDQARDYLDRVQNAAQRMQTLINDLLTYARVSTKAQPFVSTDLVKVTREVVSDLEVRIEQANGRVEVGELPQLDADPLQVRQLMQNLIGNALKYKRPDVAPVVKVFGRHPVNKPLVPVGHSANPFCEILIEDNGIGFDEIYVDRIFTIFQRLHGRTEYEGTGVGLAVCRKIAERHGGTITARSTLGAGSTFMVTLPMRHPKEPVTDGCAT
jgi:signal transduction histidine kinase